MAAQPAPSDDKSASAAREATSAKDTAPHPPPHPVLTWAGQVVAGFYRSLQADRTLPAIGREAVKDVRFTIHEVFFGRGENGHEYGAPLNPLPSEIANDNHHGGEPHGVAPPNIHSSLPSPEEILAKHSPQAQQSGQPLPSPEAILAKHREVQLAMGLCPPSEELGHGVHGPQAPENGQVLMQEKTWQEKEWEREQARKGGNTGGDGYDRQKERILPEEQRKAKEQEKDRGGHGR